MIIIRDPLASAELTFPASSRWWTVKEGEREKENISQSARLHWWPVWDIDRVAFYLAKLCSFSIWLLFRLEQRRARAERRPEIGDKRRSVDSELTCALTGPLS